METIVESQAISQLEHYFDHYRKQVVGIDATFKGPFGEKPVLYADWTASGRLYAPIEEAMLHQVGPFVANTHTETSATGTSMTLAYHHAKKLIKEQLGAFDNDILISSNSGMTGVVNKLQRILGLKVHEKYQNLIQLPEDLRPVIFCTHMEHHSNQTSWIETIGDVVIIEPNKEGLVCLESFEALLVKYRKRKTKIAAVTSCSNVTGIMTPYHEIAEIIHKHGGLCFVDFACSAPYIDICMRPANKYQHLDAIYFSPHKFLGGPGTTGILVFDPSLYKNRVPDNPGGGTVDYTNPWGEHKFVESIEAREDGGTPAFLQTIKIAFAMQLKVQMGVDKMMAREHELLKILFKGLEPLDNVHILAGHVKERLGVFSFYIDNLHYNLGVKLLNDRFGVQSRGGCSCAGTYGHYLLEVASNKSHDIYRRIQIGDLSVRPGWIRVSVHPVMTNKEVETIVESIRQLSMHHSIWAKDYEYNGGTNEFDYIGGDIVEDCHERVASWFDQSW